MLGFILPSLRLDARKTTVRNAAGQRQRLPGKKCGSGYIAAYYNCLKDKKGGKMSAAGRQNVREYAAKVREIKGLPTAEYSRQENRYKKGIADFNKRVESGELKRGSREYSRELHKTTALNPARIESQKAIERRKVEILESNPRFQALSPKGQAFVRGSIAGAMNARDETYDLVQALEDKTPVHTNTSLGLARVKRIIKPSKTSPYGSVSVESVAPGTAGTRENIKLDILTQRMRDRKKPTEKAAAAANAKKYSGQNAYKPRDGSATASQVLAQMDPKDRKAAQSKAKGLRVIQGGNKKTLSPMESFQQRGVSKAAAKAVQQKAKTDRAMGELQKTRDRIKAKHAKQGGDSPYSPGVKMSGPKRSMNEHRANRYNQINTRIAEEKAKIEKIKTSRAKTRDTRLANAQKQLDRLERDRKRITSAVGGSNTNSDLSRGVGDRIVGITSAGKVSGGATRGVAKIPYGDLKKSHAVDLTLKNGKLTLETKERYKGTPADTAEMKAYVKKNEKDLIAHLTKVAGMDDGRPKSTRAKRAKKEPIKSRLEKRSAANQAAIKAIASRRPVELGGGWAARKQSDISRLNKLLSEEADTNKKLARTKAAKQAKASDRQAIKGRAEARKKQKASDNAARNARKKAKRAQGRAIDAETKYKEGTFKRTVRELGPVQASLGSVKDTAMQANLRRRIQENSKNGKISKEGLNRTFNAVSGSKKYRSAIEADLKRAGAIAVPNTKAADTLRKELKRIGGDTSMAGLEARGKAIDAAVASGLSTEEIRRIKDADTLSKRNARVKRAKNKKATRATNAQIANARVSGKGPTTTYRSGKYNLSIDGFSPGWVLRSSDRAKLPRLIN